MSLSSLSVKRGIAFAMVFVIVLGAGLFSLSRLKIDMYPDMEYPMVAVMTSYTGASPEDIETLVSRPIEEGLGEVEGVEKLSSSSKRGTSVVSAEFDWGTDIDQAETEVRRALEMVEGRLPDDADDPIVFAMDPNMQPSIIFALNGPMSLDDLRKLAEDDISQQIERIPGVASVDVSGGSEREIHVTVDPTRLSALGLNINTILGAIYQDNTQEPGGAIEQGRMDFTIQTEGRYQSVDEIGETVVAQHNGADGIQIIRLKDVATIDDGFEETQRIIEVNGKPSVWIQVRKQSGANTVEVCESVQAKMPQILKNVSSNIETRTVYDQSQFINDSMGNLSSTGLTAIAISFVVLLVFLRSFRSALVVASAIPFSLLATFFLMDQSNMTLNIISMAGLALAVGMLVDNGIVVLENIFRLREEGMPIREAAAKGASQMGTAIVASTLTTVSVFIPILFVEGIAGVLFKDMALTICFALVTSLLVAMTFVPLVASRILTDVDTTKSEPSKSSLFTRFQEGYGKALDWTLGHRWIVPVGVAILLGITVVLIRFMPFDFMAANDESSVYVSLETAVTNNIDETHRVSSKAIGIIEDTIPFKDRNLIGLDLGSDSGFAAMFSEGIHTGSIRVPLVSPSKRDASQFDYENALREKLKEVPGLEVSLGSPVGPTGSAEDMTVQIIGYDLQTSRQLGRKLKKALEEMPEMAEVNFSMQDQKPQLSIVFNRAKMAQLGLSTGTVGASVSTFFKGRVAAQYSEDGEEYNILVRFPEDKRSSVEELKRMPVITPAGKTLQLQDVADVTETLGPTTVEREDQYRISTLECFLKDGYSDDQGQYHNKDLSASIASVDRLLASQSWPDGFSYNIGGNAEDFQESFAALGLALLVAVFLVYMVMAGQFESLRQPFIILFTMPLALIGVVLIFVLTGSSLDVTAFIGAIMLAGIVVNNGIVLLDGANQLREKGLDRLTAIAQAARQRLRPVLLTSLTTILAMIPLALEIGDGSESWSGMARSVIGGLSVATVLTLFVVPVMYSLFARKNIPTEVQS
ncbi:MAG: efflux RND transporter permease subunit [Deltaproteobacteria bacterium]|nr:efflux RND transporter permease subunit [Deltaproteobacteria bacterium]